MREEKLVKNVLSQGKRVSGRPAYKCKMHIKTEVGKMETEDGKFMNGQWQEVISFRYVFC